MSRRETTVMSRRHLSGLVILICALALTGAAGWASAAVAPVARAAATCSDYESQAAAQRAADTRDADGDGVYCETLPCPCLGVPDSGGDPPPAPGCTARSGVQRLSFSSARYPNIRQHFRAAVRRGWPRTLVLNRSGADARRDRLLEHFPTRAGYDRDEYPPAVGRGRGKGLLRGSDPRGWKADVRHVPSSENRSHGATMGAKLSGLCDGVRFRYVFR